MSANISIDKSLLYRVENTIANYKLLPRREIVVAYSGGKDSLFVCIVLKILGYNVIPVIVDIGYNYDWSIAIANAKTYQLDAIVLSVDQIKKILPNAYNEVSIYFGNVSKISHCKSKLTTICTPCYNAKVTVLHAWAKYSNVNTIAFGHSGTDAIASLLKNYYMYIDRWEKCHKNFNIENIENLIGSQRKYFANEEESIESKKLLADIVGLISKRFVGTDEPIRQKLDDSEINIVRPIFDIFEYEIIRCYEKAFEFEGHECHDYRTPMRFTTREIIHYRLLQNAKEKMLIDLHKIAYMCLDDEGCLLFSARNNRKEILGTGYKSESICDEKL